MSDFREEEKLGKIYDTQLTRRLMKYLRPYRWWVVLAVSMTLAVAALEIVGPYLFHVGIDRYIVPGLRGNDCAKRRADWACFGWSLAYVGSILASFGLQYVQVRIMQWVGQETMYDLRKEIFAHLQRLPMSFFDRSPVGRLVTRATTDVDALNDLFASGVVAMLNDFVLLFGMAAVLFKWHPTAGSCDAFAAAVHDLADLFFPQSRARCQPPHPHRHRPHQRVPAGTHQRHGRRAAFQPRAEIPQAVRRAEPHSHGGV